MENIIDLAIDTKSINLSNQKLTELPDLSCFTQLETLVCDNNRLTSLPDNLPNSIKTLWCYNNRLASLPEKLPDSLENLWCHNNLISSIPSRKDYFPKLKDLCISKNNLTHFPDNIFNSSLLENISICDNQIAYLQHDVNIHSLKYFTPFHLSIADFVYHNSALPNYRI
jgi:Leucine-rich repeat (LRR) protein